MSKEDSSAQDDSFAELIERKAQAQQVVESQAKPVSVSIPQTAERLDFAVPASATVSNGQNGKAPENPTNQVNKQFKSEFKVEKAGFASVGTTTDLAQKIEKDGYQCLPQNAIQNSIH